MALKKCKECGEQVSTKAASCPKCGALNKQGVGCISGGAKIGCGIIMMAPFLMCFGAVNTMAPTEEEKKESVARLNASVEAQKAYIETTIANKQVCERMTMDEVTRAWGPPSHSTTMQSGRMAVTTWTYGSLRGSMTVLTFKEGRVSGITRMQ